MYALENYEHIYCERSCGRRQFPDAPMSAYFGRRQRWNNGENLTKLTELLRLHDHLLPFPILPPSKPLPLRHTQQKPGATHQN